MTPFVKWRDLNILAAKLIQLDDTIGPSYRQVRARGSLPLCILHATGLPPLLDPFAVLDLRGDLPFRKRQEFMGKNYFPEEQVAFALRQQEEGTPVA